MLDDGVRGSALTECAGTGRCEDYSRVVQCHAVPSPHPAQQQRVTQIFWEGKTTEQTLQPYRAEPEHRCSHATATTQGLMGHPADTQHSCRASVLKTMPRQRRHRGPHDSTARSVLAEPAPAQHCPKGTGFRLDATGKGPASRAMPAERIRARFKAKRASICPRFETLSGGQALGACFSHMSRLAVRPSIARSTVWPQELGAGPPLCDGHGAWEGALPGPAREHMCQPAAC
ncbi:hypothetical protein AAFF_G00115990 [Aldrovandia affinis]|uniref:Uncharacterized protein n=1 Tax=Aldrovandia affinis TaxID=143900 RepID=A0AAD7WXK0_9TELE|nr:hypothetical protein AAFF_G00115990 [Aldrovandia affinis]